MAKDKWCPMCGGKMMILGMCPDSLAYRCFRCVLEIEITNHYSARHYYVNEALVTEGLMLSSAKERA